MSQDSPRIAELRRRVQADPASIAFAQLAEEYRRAGHYHEAVKYCRTGLARHPGYLSARVTLGRALMELGELDDAAREFELVLRSAPDNLATIRGMAEIHQRRGAMEAALDYYKRALALARFDSELEESVNRIAHEIGCVESMAGDGLSFEEARSQLLSAASLMPPAEPRPPDTSVAEPPPPSGAPAAAEPLIDFDALLASLGLPNASPPPVMEMLLSDQATTPGLADALLPDVRDLPEGNAPADPFAALEDDLRTFDERPLARHLHPATPFAPVTTSIDRTNQRVVEELEAWLRVLKTQSAAPTT